MESATNKKIRPHHLEKANDPRTSPEEKDDLLKQAHQYEMVAIDDQQTANNLLDDVQEKYPFETTTTEEVSASLEEDQLERRKHRTY